MMNDYLGKDIPKLGFGLMRLPHIDNDMSKEIDFDHLQLMVDLFMESGFSYFDTAYGYMGSEEAIGKTLVAKYPRESYVLATKLPAWTVKTQEEAERMIDVSLERTGVDYFDFYLLHNIGAHRAQIFEDFKIWEYLARKKEEGVIRHLGFSLHDKADKLDEILTAHPEAEFVQLQLNYGDWENPTVEARKCYEVAMKHDTPIVVMEPVKGGNLMSLPQPAIDILKAADPNSSLASWAVRFAASLDGIITVLSGMSNIEQMRDNIATFQNFTPLSPEETKVIEAVRTEIDKVESVPCTSCGYCVPECPQDIAIPGCFESLNMYLHYGKLPNASFNYGWNTKGHGKESASACIECGVCESVCTQSIPIIQDLKRAREIFEPEAK